ncbi:MAG: type II/IV secretion system protein [Verrucomicrobia bacterium]|nr:MAG: type II/IV secretion system protein [Verrucomicrobiota bacterium]
MSESPSAATTPRAAFPLLDALKPEQREHLLELPRARRAEWLATETDTPLDQILHLIAEQTGLELVNPDRFDLEALRLVPVRLVNEYHCVPVRPSSAAPAAAADAATPEGAAADVPAAEPAGEILHLATSWPPEPLMDEWILAACGRDVVWHLAHPEKISKFITENLGVGADSLDDSDDTPGLAAEAETEDEDENAAVIRFVNQVIAQAIEDGATDIHFEPQEESLRIRYRIDGLLVPVPLPDNLRRFQEAITSRLKIMAKLNISERRLPQDGRITYKTGDSTLDIRLSTIPTIYGESVSLRLLNKKSQPLTLEQLGLGADDQAQIRKVLDLPHGIILVTGPTGSGKSTSLSAFIREINSTEKRIITIEDPIEYEIPGVNQMQVRPEIGLTFASGLRHILRQDPNVIMVGEIRDRDTADIAIRASLTGHLVFSTIHTNDAPGAVTRLVDMGIEPFLIASAVELVIAQRLVRRLCQACTRLEPISPVTLQESLAVLEVEPAEAAGVSEVHVPVGCEACRHSGYRGRIGIFEILRVGEHLHDLIVRRESSRVIRKVAIEHGMQTLGQSGWKQVRKGLTSLEEVVRTVSMAESA